jgi:hypothetical protein
MLNKEASLGRVDTNDTCIEILQGTADFRRQGNGVFADEASTILAAKGSGLQSKVAERICDELRAREDKRG